MQAGEVFGELFAFGGIAEDALDHAHFSVEVVDHGDEDGFGGGGHSGGAPFFFALVTENNVFEALGQVGVEFGLDRGFAGGAEAEYDVALQGADAADLGGEISLILFELTDVVEENAGDGEVGIDLRVEGEERPRGTHHVGGVFEQAVAVGVVHADRGGTGTELRPHFVHHALYGLAQLCMLDRGDGFFDVGPEFPFRFRWDFDELMEHALGFRFGRVDFFGGLETRGEAILVIFRLASEADNGAFGYAFECGEDSRVAEGIGREAAAAVAQFDAEERVAVLRGFHRLATQNKNTAERCRDGGIELLELLDGFEFAHG